MFYSQKKYEMQFKAEKNKSEEHPQYSTENGTVFFHIISYFQLQSFIIYSYLLMT